MQSMGKRNHIKDLAKLNTVNPKTPASHPRPSNLPRGPAKPVVVEASSIVTRASAAASSAEDTRAPDRASSVKSGASVKTTRKKSRASAAKKVSKNTKKSRVSRKAQSRSNQRPIGSPTAMMPASPSSASSTASKSVVPPLASAAGGAPVQLAFDGLTIGSSQMAAPPPALLPPAAKAPPPGAKSADENEDDDEKPLSPRKRDDDEGAQSARQKLLDAASARAAVEEQESAERRLESLARGFYNTEAAIDLYREALLRRVTADLHMPEVDVSEQATEQNGSTRGTVFSFVVPEAMEAPMRLKLATSAVAIYGHVEFEKATLTVQCANCEAAVLCASQLKRSDGAHLPITWPSPVKTTNFTLKSNEVFIHGFAPMFLVNDGLFAALRLGSGAAWTVEARGIVKVTTASLKAAGRVRALVTGWSIMTSPLFCIQM